MTRLVGEGGVKAGGTVRTVGTVGTSGASGAVAASETGSTVGTVSGRVLSAVGGGLGLANEAVLTLLTAGEGTALLPELGHGDGGECGGSVVLSSVVVDLVDGNGGVGDVRLDGLCNWC